MTVTKKTILFLTILMAVVSGTCVSAVSLIPDGDAFMIIDNSIIGNSDDGLVLSDFSCRDVARAADGSFVVVGLLEVDYTTSSDRDDQMIYAQRFTAEGSPLTPVTRVSPKDPPEPFEEDETGNSLAPSVACDASGNFVVAWKYYYPHNNGYASIYARHFKADGTPLGEPFALGSPGDQVGHDPDVAMNDQGACVIAWAGTRFPRRKAFTIFMRRFDPKGQPLENKPIQFSSLNFKDELETSGQRFPSVAINNDGEIAVSWIRTVVYGRHMLYLQTGDEYLCHYYQHIAIQFFNSSGEAKGRPAIVWQKTRRKADYITSYIYEQAPNLCMTNSGDVSVSWYVYDEGIFSRLYAPEGPPQSDIIPISVPTEKTKTYSVMDSSGNLAVFWRDGYPDSSPHSTLHQIFGQGVNANGLLDGSAIELIESPSNAEGPRSSYPHAASDSYGNIVVVWKEAGYDIDGIMARNFIFQHHE